MSAYVVSDDTINIILGFVASSDTAKKHLQSAGINTDPETLGNSMFALNIDAVEQRYGKGQAAEFRALNYKYEAVLNAEPDEALERLGEWHYQCAEGDVPDTSTLYAAMDSLKAAVLPEIQKQKLETHGAKMKADAELAAINWKKLEAMKPEKAQALIIAELHEDDSDLMTDYPNYRTVRKVAIGWRTGSREDFRQLRKAAATFEPTEAYGTGCDRYTIRAVYTEDEPDNGRWKGDYWPVADLHGKTFPTQAKAQAEIDANPLNMSRMAYTIEKSSIEHRENWSMGAGNYLGNGKYSGWIVKSCDLKWSRGSDVIETDHLEALQRKPDFGAIYGDPETPAYITDHGPVWMWRKGQRVRFYTAEGEQVGPEQNNVAPAVAAAMSAGWINVRMATRFAPIAPNARPESEPEPETQPRATGRICIVPIPAYDLILLKSVSTFCPDFLNPKGQSGRQVSTVFGLR